MKQPRFFPFGSSLLMILALVTPMLSAHFDHQEPRQSYRQSVFALIAMNFGPIMSMAKGDTEWDQNTLTDYVIDLDHVANLNLSAGFTTDSKEGKTRAKPEIWEDTDDFESKISELRDATENLRIAVKYGDKTSILSAIKSTGKSCKGCHDKYKAKDYIY